MPIELISRLNDKIPVDVRDINPSNMHGKTNAQLAKTAVHRGNRSVELGELFDVRGNADDDQIIWEGNLRHVHHIGYLMDHGEWIVNGTAGNHVGREMSGGQITVRGNVGDNAGSQMHGGLIWIRGNAGDQPGGCYPGSKIGMNRGAILIDGNSGAAAGRAMRRGMIAIGGDTKSGLGTNMLAGTIFVRGQCHSSIGLNMKRGTIIVASKVGSETEKLPSANFRRSGCFRSPTVIGLIANWLEQTGFSFDKERLVEQRFERYSGDQVCGGRGELFIPA